MLSRLFRKSASADRIDLDWWQTADRIADTPGVNEIDALDANRQSAAEAPDEAERQEEMVAALRRLWGLADRPLPVVATQHRVIGADACHFVGPATLAGAIDVPGKVFLTSRRLVFAGGTVLAWPWHRIGSLLRVDRDLVVAITGGDPARVRFNSYADALEARHLANRLRAGNATG